MHSLLSRIRAKDGKLRSRKNGGADSTPQLPAKPRWDDAYARTSVEPEEVQDLIRRCTVELKARALDIPFLLLPFRPTSNPSAVRTFIRHFFDDSHGLHGEALSQELRMTEPMVISDVLKWCWCRIPGGLIGWDAYELFKVGEQDSNMARDSFSTFIPLSIENEARSKIAFDYFDLLSAIAAHGKVNGFGGRKLSRMASWWAFEHRELGNGFEGGYKIFSSAADATSHLFFAYLRSLSPQQPKSAAISMLPMSLQKLLQDTEYPPQTPSLMLSSTYKVVMIVDTVSPTPFALLRRANHFQYREEDRHLQEFSEYEDPVEALTEECRRVLKAISLANQSHVSSSKHSTGLRDASWSRFEDIGFAGTLEEVEEDEDTVRIGLVPRSQGLRATPASGVNLGRPTTPSWADFLSSGFVDDSGPSNMLLPPDKALPPIETTVRQRSSQSHRPRLESDRQLEPGELASITRFDLDDAFWWVWMSSLAPEETAERKSAFGRCAVVETAVRSGKWLVMEEMVKGAAPEPDAGAYIAEKKGLFSWTRRGRTGISRSKSTSKGAFDRGDRLNASNTTGNMLSRTSIGPDQQAKIHAAAQQLSARQQQQQREDLPERRGRIDPETSGDRTNSVLTLQPVIMKEASPAMKWASKYDKDTVREAYLGNMNAGRGHAQLNGTNTANGGMANGDSYRPDVPEKPLSPLLSSGIQPHTPAKEEAPAVPQKNLEDIHPAERPDAVGRNSPLPPLPRDDSLEATRQTMASPEPDSSPDSKKHKKLHKHEKRTGSGLRKLFGRNKNRQSKVPENVATDVNALSTVQSSRAQTPLPETPRSQPRASESSHRASPVQTEDDKTPTQLSVPGEAHEPTYDPSAADETEARAAFSRFDQGPLADQPAFAPDAESEDDDAVPPPIARHASDLAQGQEGEAAPSPVVGTEDRWAAIRRNAAERAARQSEEQSRGGYSKTTDGEDETSGEETIESRVARIKARVAELTGNMEGTASPGSPPQATRR
ncbi:putative morphogenesis protein [Rosellinia necatrix]|uniref:Putative morphogenesis protein n=1 Tax=Rosellinia necatrix TaxID=77044 RepID=A0A1W2TKE3_ROSNE|nr:putative morphogenesis protein [Rosellinia necatrix]